MKFIGSTSNYQRIISYIIGIGASFSLTSIVDAATVNPVRSNAVTASNANIIELAQATSTCPQDSGGSQFVSAETKNFLVYICGGDNPNTYVGIAKNGGQGITLPLQSYNRNRFVAVNGDTRYTLTRTELIVTQKGRVIARETAQWKR